MKTPEEYAKWVELEAVLRNAIASRNEKQGKAAQTDFERNYPRRKKP